MRIINPETGSVVHENASPVGRPSYARDDGQVWVEIRPSFRPGMPYDLASYPPEWLEPEDQIGKAVALLTAEARRRGAPSISALHEVIDANEAIADALETAGFDALDHEAANAITAQADALLAGGAMTIR